MAAGDCIVSKEDIAGCLIDKASFEDLVARLCELEKMETASVLRASSNSTGFRWSNTNLPATTIITSPFLNSISLTNTNSVPVVVEVKWNFGDTYMFIADGDLRVRAYGQVLRNGGAIENTGIAHYNWLDSEPFGNTQQQTEMRNNGTAYNDTFIIAQPGDVITAQQQLTVQAISGGNAPERAYWYNGQSVITMHPQTVLIPKV